MQSFPSSSCPLTHVFAPRVSLSHVLFTCWLVWPLAFTSPASWTMLLSSNCPSSLYVCFLAPVVRWLTCLLLLFESRFSRVSWSDPWLLRAQHHGLAWVRVGEPAAVLLGPAAGRANGAPVHRRVRLRLRVHGAERAARHHAPHRQDHAHHHTGQPPASHSTLRHSCPAQGGPGWGHAGRLGFYPYLRYRRHHHHHLQHYHCHRHHRHHHHHHHHHRHHHHHHHLRRCHHHHCPHYRHDYDMFFSMVRIMIMIHVYFCYAVSEAAVHVSYTGKISIPLTASVCN